MLLSHLSTAHNPLPISDGSWHFPCCKYHKLPPDRTLPCQPPQGFLHIPRKSRFAAFWYGSWQGSHVPHRNVPDFQTYDKHFRVSSLAAGCSPETVCCYNIPQAFLPPALCYRYLHRKATSSEAPHKVVLPDILPHTLLHVHTYKSLLKPLRNQAAAAPVSIHKYHQRNG